MVTGKSLWAFLLAAAIVLLSNVSPSYGWFYFSFGPSVVAENPPTVVYQYSPPVVYEYYPRVYSAPIVVSPPPVMYRYPIYRNFYRPVYHHRFYTPHHEYHYGHHR